MYQEVSQFLHRWRIAIVIIILLIAIALITPLTYLGPDYLFSYHTAASYWLAGDRPLYAFEQASADYTGFYNPPWFLFMVLPFAMLPLQLGQAIWHVLSGVSLLGAIHTFTRPRISPIAVALSVANIFTVDMFLRGQIDAFILGATLVGWWSIRQHKPYLLGFALIMMAIKPPNLILVSLLYALSIRHWSRKDWAKVIIIPVGVLITTTLIVGVDWPLNYLAMSEQYPIINYLNSTLWRSLDLLNIPKAPFIILAIIACLKFLQVAWRDGLTRRTFSLALTTNLLFTIYANGNHYVILIPAFLFVFQCNWRYALFIYLFAWTSLLRGIFGYNAAVLDIGYVLLLWISSWLMYRCDISLESTDAEANHRDTNQQIAPNNQQTNRKRRTT